MISERHAAIFLDFENIYYTLKNSLPAGYDVIGSVSALLRALRKEVSDQLKARPLILRAYADFERLGEDVQRALFLTGYDPQYVLGTDHKNAADMRLCIDAMVTLYTRPDVHLFVVAAGDRDYIPMLNHLIERGKDVYVVSFIEALSGDLRTIVGDGAILSASSLLNESTLAAMAEVQRQRELDAKAEKIRELEAAKNERQLRSVAVQIPTPVLPSKVEFEAIQAIDDPHVADGLTILVREYGHHPEVFLRPFLYRLEREFQWKADWEIKEMVQEMERCGAIVVERRDNMDKSYSVVIINYDHPQVRQSVT